MVYGTVGVLTWIDSQSGKVTPFLLMPEEKRNYVDRERYYVYMIHVELFGLVLMVTAFLYMMFQTGK